MRKRIALGAAIKAIREARSLQHPEYAGSRFSIAVGMSHAHLCNIEAGRKQPPEEVLYRIAAALGVPIDAISYTIEHPSEATAS